MQTTSTRHVAAFAAALALALVPATASAVLERVGPNRPDNFLPTWYQDTTGLTMEFCTPETQAELDGGWCLILPVDVPGGLAPEVFPNAFSGEHFYWASDVVGDWAYTIPAAPGQTPITITSKVLLVQAIEAAFLGDIGPGLGQVFGRVRLRIIDLPLTGIYKFYTPWGIKEIAGLAGDRIFDTEDIGINCPPFQYDCALETSIGPFLLPSNEPGGAELPPTPGPSGGFFLSDPARVGPVTGSPVVGTYNIAEVGQYTQVAPVATNPNVFAIEAPDGQVIFKSHNFSTVGRVWTAVIPGRVKSDRASYAREPGGAIQLHAFATGEPTVAPRLPAAPPSVATQPQLHLFSAPCTGTVDPTGNLLPPYGEPVGETSIPMSRNGNLYFASTAPAAVPAGVCVKDANARTAQGVVQPTYTLGNVTDQVFVTAAVYDPSNGGSLSVRASSSDEFAPPLLSVGAFGTLLANVPLTDDLAYMTPVAAPPEHVRVHSQEGGTAELLVKVGSRKATSATLSSDRAGLITVGTPVVFTASCVAASECLYRYLLTSGGITTVVLDWSSLRQWVLPVSTPEGGYQVAAQVWSGLSPSSPDATSNVIGVTLRQVPATSVSLAASAASPTLPGAPVVFTATGFGSSAPYSFRFFLGDGNGNNFVVVQDWSASNQWPLPAATATGAYTVAAEVRTSSFVTRDAVAFLTHSVATPPPTPADSVLLTPSAASPAPVGTAVEFVAQGQGGTPPYAYRFWLGDANGSNFAVVQDWSALDRWSLPASAAAGGYTVGVEVRTSSLVARDAVTFLPFRLVAPVVAPTPADSVLLTPGAASPAPVGTAVEFVAQGQGGTPPYAYRFWLGDANGGNFIVVQDWSALDRWSLPASAAAGGYTVGVEVRTSSLVTRDAVTFLPFRLVELVVAPTPADSVLLTPGAASPAPVGTAVEFVAQGQGGTPPYAYRFWLGDGNGNNFAMVQDWSALDRWSLPASAVAGGYTIGVEVRTSSLVTRDAVTFLPFRLSIP